MGDASNIGRVGFLAVVLGAGVVLVPAPANPVHAPATQIRGVRAAARWLAEAPAVSAARAGLSRAMAAKAAQTTDPTAVTATTGDEKPTGSPDSA